MGSKFYVKFLCKKDQNEADVKKSLSAILATMRDIVTTFSYVS